MIDSKSIYSDYHNKVYGYLYGKVNNAVIAEDLTSDVFVKIISKLDSYDESKAGLSTWIYNITRNTLYDYFRTRHETGELGEDFAVDDDFVEKICTNEMLEQLSDALNVLLPREREIIIRRYYHQQSLVSIAEQMDISKSYVFVLQNKALEKLKGYFKI